jgi:predicted DNA-binding antitoxin AbrB/MazE fold protein
MSRTVKAIFENGVFRPIEPVPDFGEKSTVLLTIRKPLDRDALHALAGTLPDEDAEEMMRVTKEGRRVDRDR